MRLKHIELTYSERLRGEDKILMVILATYVDNTQEYKVSGVSYIDNMSQISEGLIKATENSKENLKLLSLDTTNAENVVPLDLVRETIKPAMDIYLRKNKPTRDEHSELNELVNEPLQIKLDQLCEALGITRIDVKEKAWTNLEVIVLISYLSKLAEPLK